MASCKTDLPVISLHPAYVLVHCSLEDSTFAEIIILHVPMSYSLVGCMLNIGTVKKQGKQPILYIWSEVNH